MVFVFEWKHEYLPSFREIPEPLAPVIRALERLDNIKYEEIVVKRSKRFERLTGLKLLLNAIEREIIRQPTRYMANYTINSVPVNVIPRVGDPGPCTETLLVFIGSADIFELRLLEAIEHSGALCRNTTKYVIFYALKWDDVVWKRHEQSFKMINVAVFLKPFGRPPARLL